MIWRLARRIAGWTWEGSRGDGWVAERAAAWEEEGGGDDFEEVEEEEEEEVGGMVRRWA